jgi:hypothetical protein
MGEMGRCELMCMIGNFEVLSRSRNEETPETNDEGLVQEGSA